MNLFLILILITILLETSYLCFVNKKPQAKAGISMKRSVFVDTSTLMDGRIVSIAKAGFIGDKIYVARSVVRELQLLADGSDAEKRSRARFGLDVINQLKNIDNLDIEIFADADGRTKVDERLLELAREHSGIIMTNDYNLAKVASIEQICAINVNDLAQGLRSEYLPGDKLNVKIISVGSNAHQGIAYLPDSTMVVVDNADKYAGKNESIEIEFERYLQTAAGRMMFAKITAKPKKETATSKRKKSVKTTSAGRKKQTKSNKK